METAKHLQKKIITFILLTFAISSISYCLMFSTGSASRVVLAWMWSPGIAAILTQLLFRGKLRDLGWRPGEARYLALGYALPLIYAPAIYVFAWGTGLGGFHGQPFVIGRLHVPFPISTFIFAFVGMIPNCITALGEEIGWRGLLVPELSRITTFTRTALVSGIIWAVWHYPAIILADYHSKAPLWFDLSTITVAVFGMGVFTAWLRLKSGSIWPAVLWHANHNLLIQTIFLGMTTDTGLTEYIVDDFGAGVLVSSLIVGYIFWRKRSELPNTLLQEGTGDF